MQVITINKSKNYTNYNYNQKSNKSNIKKDIILKNTNSVYAYQDFNITFQARTPENFYEQSFNVNNMPETMKSYLYADFSNRKHIPPEQIIQEVFKYIKLAKDFDTVQKFYPEETLFQDLHKINKKPNNTILDEIQMVKELNSKPLFKDGSDDLGMYLLRKIYCEGKTIKEINKDFYENDLDESYKGLLTKQINYNTTNSYGIRYPKLPFWKSFIATRDEYRKFFITLPKKDLYISENVKNQSGVQKSKEQAKIIINKNVESKRKYKTPLHKKSQLSNEIKNTKSNIQTIEKKIKKKFYTTNQETPFVIKYISPIMTIAAERVHLSEEMRNFAAKKHIEVSDSETFFARFWKENPLVLEDYAKTIPDTIELFEETYNAGGLIPINKDFEIVKPETKNKEIIDYVPEEFVELLQYAQNIGENRKEKYALHDKIQNELNEKLALTNTLKQVELPVHSENIKYNEAEIEKHLIETAKLNNAEVYSFVDDDGNKFIFTGTLDEEFEKAMIPLLGSAEYYPDIFQKKYIEFLLSQPQIDEKYKLSTIAIAKKITLKNLYTFDELKTIMDGIEFDDKLYFLPSLTLYMIEDYIAEKDPALATQLSQGNLFKDIRNSLCQKDENTFIPLSEIILKEKNVFNNNVKNYYSVPLSRSEIIQVKMKLLEFLQNYDSNQLKQGDYNLLLGMLKNSLTSQKDGKKAISMFLDEELSSKDKDKNYIFTRSILSNKIPKEILNQRILDTWLLCLERNIYSNKAEKIIDIIGEKLLLFSLDCFSSEMNKNLLNKICKKSKF